MDAFRLFKRATGAALLFTLAALIIGCGSAPTSSASTVPSSTSATATACVALLPRTVAGTLQNINGNTLTITNLQGKSVTATYSSTTRFTRQTAVTVSSLQEGGFVAVQVSKQPDNTYAATRITVTNRNNFQGNGQQRRNNTNNNNNGCPRPNRPANGGRNGNGGNGANANGARGVTGTIGQINGSTVTVTEASGSDFTVTVTKDTQIVQTVQATSADLKTGTPITLTGQANSQGTIAAQNILILLPGMLNRTNLGG
ncbi:MAG TPA: DUF5666 domain-containing protein [Ktedonosporobacter sp.]|jgi:hypothetical protein|nr:DUF5666 domain-containing protein [Ktedonosporobacter sp.]